MTDQPTARLSGDEIMALKFAAHRQLARWANKHELQPRQHAQRAALARAVRVLQDKALAHGCELHVSSEELPSPALACSYRLRWRPTPTPASYTTRSGVLRGPVAFGHVTDIGSSRWTIHGERVVDESRRLRLSIAEVELPDGVRFEQYVLRLPRAAMMIVLDDSRERVLMMWRHRFIIDRWVWELPGGYVDPHEDPTVTAAREVEEETGWRPREARLLVSFQPMLGSADAENLLFISHGADHTGQPPDINETQKVEWISLASVPELIERGEVAGAGSLVGLLHVVAFTPT